MLGIFSPSSAKTILKWKVVFWVTIACAVKILSQATDVSTKAITTKKNYPTTRTISVSGQSKGRPADD